MTGHHLWPSLLPAQRWNDPSLCAVSATGVRVSFADGRDLLCGTSGLWNVNLGYGNKNIADAVSDAMERASYLNVFRYENVDAQLAADALISAAGEDKYSRVLFSTSGGAANDLVMKLSRHLQALRGEPGRSVVVGLRDSYHGLTYGGFAMTGEDLGQRLYSVDQRHVRHVGPNDVDELRALFARQGRLIAAVIVEPVLGTGTVPLTKDFVNALLELRAEHGFLLVADEVATGYGRTGPMFASGEWPEAPDLMVVSKGLTNGVAAAAAVLAGPNVVRHFENSPTVLAHGETQAGTPATCAAIVATLNEFDRLDAVALGRRNATTLEQGLQELRHRFPDISALTGSGLFRSVRIGGESQPLGSEQVTELVTAVRAEGAVVHPGLSGVQLIPALTYTPAEMTELLDTLHRGLVRFGLSTRTDINPRSDSTLGRREDIERIAS